MEIWKEVKGYEGYYEISDLGNLRGMKRTVEHSKYGDHRISSKPLKPTITSLGYLACGLSRVFNGVTKKESFKVHRLVAIAFIPNPENKEQVNHINGIKTDNRLVNLEWNTRSENLLHAGRMGLKTYKKADGVHNAKFSMEEVRKIRKNYIEEKQSHAKIAKKYNVNKNTILKIVQNLSYVE